MPVHLLPLFPLPLVLFPGAPLPLHIFEPRYRQMLSDCLSGDSRFGIVFRPEGMGDADLEPGRVGCIAEVDDAHTLPDGRSNIVVHGVRRFSLQRFVASPAPYYVGEVTEYDDLPEEESALGPIATRVRELFARVGRAARALADDHKFLPQVGAGQQGSIRMLFEPLFAHAKQQPQHTAVIDDRGQYTHAQLAAASAGMAMYLSSQTQQPRVGLLLPTSAGFAASFYGTLLAGKTVVPINFLLGEREIAHIIQDSGIDTIVSVAPLSGKLKDLPQGASLKVIDLAELMQQFAPVLAGAGSGELVGQAAAGLPTPATDDIAVLMYTSGTSGLPKGVLLTYGNLSSDVEAAIRHADLQGKHKFLGVLPLFHSTGLLATLIAPVRLGATVIYQARFSPVGIIKAVREHQISIIAAVPSMYGAMLRMKDAGPKDFENLYAAISGGEPLPATVREGFESKFGQPIYEGYGLTETIGPIAFNVPGQRRPGSVGRLIPGAEVRLSDDDGNAVAQGQVGEVWLRGPMIMKGYYNLPDETAAALTPDGFFKTGDLGRLDEDGYLFITGRKKDLIIVAGEKASPREIEEVLHQHPAVSEVAVLGKKDPSRGEVVVAFVTVKEGQTLKPDELRDFGRQKGLVQWKIPREVFVVNELPHSPTGKVLKRVLAERLASEGA